MDVEEILDYTKKLTLMIESGNLPDMELALVYIKEGSIKDEPQILENLKNHFNSFTTHFPPSEKERKNIYKEIVDFLNNGIHR